MVLDVRKILEDNQNVYVSMVMKVFDVHFGGDSKLNSSKN